MDVKPVTDRVSVLDVPEPAVPPGSEEHPPNNRRARRSVPRLARRIVTSPASSQVVATGGDWGKKF
jgi:hypothetical protein